MVSFVHPDCIALLKRQRIFSQKNPKLNIAKKATRNIQTNGDI